MVEHLTRIQEICGSNPGWGKNFSINICHLYVGQCQVIYFNFSLNNIKSCLVYCTLDILIVFFIEFFIHWSSRLQGSCLIGVYLSNNSDRCHIKLRLNETDCAENATQFQLFHTVTNSQFPVSIWWIVPGMHLHWHYKYGWLDIQLLDDMSSRHLYIY